MSIMSLGSRPRPIVHINALPGTGKLTIARLLANKLDLALANDASSSGVAAKVVHNHLLINPVDAVLHRTQPGYQELRKSLRQTIFQSIAKEPATYSTVYIFTDFQSGDSVGSAVCQEFRDVANARGAALIPVILSCEESENVRRLGAGDRPALQKLTDTELLLHFRRRQDAPSVHLFEKEHARLELDVTHLSAQEAADQICSHILKEMTETQ